MNNKLLAGLAVAGFLAGGGGAPALAPAGGPPVAASTVTVASRVPCQAPLESLVAKGTITRSQAIAIYKGLISYMHSHWQHMRGHNLSALRGALDTVASRLASEGTLTKSQASAVTGAFAQWAQRCYQGTVG